MIPLDMIWAAIRQSTTINVLNSYDHGPAHWERVDRMGVAMANETKGADLTVVRFFAFFHDMMRNNEWQDPEHGIRANKLAHSLGVPNLHLSPMQWEIFTTACADHDAGLVSDDPTIGCCWDADRLDLPRVGIIPDPALMSTDVGKVLAFGKREAIERGETR